MGVIRKVNKVLSERLTQPHPSGHTLLTFLITPMGMVQAGAGGGGEEKMGLRKENQLVFRCLRAIPSLISEVSAVLMISSG